MPPSAATSAILVIGAIALLTLTVLVVRAVNRVLQAEARVARTARRVHATAAWAVDAIPPLLDRARRYASPDPDAVSELEAAREDVLLAPTARACAVAHGRLMRALTRVRACVRENPALDGDEEVHRTLAEVERRAGQVALVIARHQDALRELGNARDVVPTRWIARSRQARRA